MKIYSISDLHLCLHGEKPMNVFGDVWDDYLDKITNDWKSKVNDDDLVLLAGDHSWAMKLEDFEKDLSFFSNLPGTKVITKGNHDYWWSSLTKVKSILPQNMVALQNDCVRFGSVIICGTRGWTVPERNAVQADEDKKIYDRELIRARLSLDQMVKMRQSSDKVIFMIHYPPFNSERQDSDFTRIFDEYGVDVVVYGHLHGKHTRSVLTEKRGNITYYLTSCDQVNMKLVEINI